MLEFKPNQAMSSTTKNIYDEHIKPLPREKREELLVILRRELENGDDHARSILELRGLGKEIWEGVDATEYVRKLRDDWDERA